ncbi:hypothetical protein [Pseudoleptotrichia goodfellowii]|uniref:hypothetical protein n=1 Tax=Pseudoleptotrichia goodfellowii TaxID=157692 RepID=UPI0004AC755A|nr:hypothetical protein [Pseudoleptotrichia goodfellowii]
MENTQFEKDTVLKNDIENTGFIPASEFQIVGADTAQSEVIYKPSLTFWQDGWRRFKKINWL